MKNVASGRVVDRCQLLGLPERQKLVALFGRLQLPGVYSEFRRRLVRRIAHRLPRPAQNLRVHICEGRRHGGILGAALGYRTA